MSYRETQGGRVKMGTPHFLQYDDGMLVCRITQRVTYVPASCCRTQGRSMLGVLLLMLSLLGDVGEKVFCVAVQTTPGLVQCLGGASLFTKGL